MQKYSNSIKKPDFELEQVLTWCRKIKKQLKLNMPESYPSKYRDRHLTEAWAKIIENQWPAGRKCEHCKTNDISVGNSKFCYKCLRIFSKNTEEAMFFGYQEPIGEE